MFFQRRHTNGQQIHGKMLNIIREMQIKTTVRYHPTYVRMAVIKKSRESVGRIWRKLTVSMVWGKSRTAPMRR